MNPVIRRGLDALYLVSGILGALFLIAILGLIVTQMVARWTSTVVPGVAEYAGYCMAASSFFTLAYALNKGSHIRVSILLSRLGRYRRWGEIWCYGIATITAVMFSYFAIKFNYWSWKFGDISQAQDATPMWIPQLAMSIGTCLLALALADHFIRILLTDHEGVEVQSITEGRD